MEKSFTLKVFETNNYNDFELLGTQREINKAHVKTFEERILEFGYLKTEPIKAYLNPRTKKKSIVDGQHKFTACKNINENFTYILLDEDKAEEYMRVANMTGKLWNTPTYINSYSKSGNIHYTFLKNWLEKYDLPLRVLPYLFKRHKKFSTNLKIGKFITTPKLTEFMELMAHRYNDVINLPLLKEMKEIRNQTPFKCAVMVVINHPEYNFKILEDKFNTHAISFIKRFSTAKDYLAMFEIIVNRSRRSRITSYTMPPIKMLEGGHITQQSFDNWVAAQPKVDF